MTTTESVPVASAVKQRKLLIWPIFLSVVIGGAVVGIIAGMLTDWKPLPCGGLLKTTGIVSPSSLEGVPSPVPPLPPAAPEGDQQALPGSNGASGSVQPTPSLGTSTEVNDLEQDLKALNLSGLDAELNAMKQEIPL